MPARTRPVKPHILCIQYKYYPQNFTSSITSKLHASTYWKSTVRICLSNTTSIHLCWYKFPSLPNPLGISRSPSSKYFPPQFFDHGWYLSSYHSFLQQLTSFSKGGFLLFQLSRKHRNRIDNNFLIWSFVFEMLFDIFYFFNCIMSTFISAVSFMSLSKATSTLRNSVFLLFSTSSFSKASQSLYYISPRRQQILTTACTNQG